MSKISLVSAYYKNELMTQDFLNNLRGKLPEGCEVILVNAGSIPIENPMITKRVDLDHNEGFSNSFNAGLKEATGDIVCIINNDAFPQTTDWLDKLATLSQKTGAYIISPTNDKTVLSNYAIMEEADDYWGMLFFPAVCWVMSRKCIDEIGLFDEQFQIGNYEDNDYCKRLGEAHEKLLVSKRVTIQHLESQTMKLFNVTDVAYENYDKFMHKWDG